MWTDLCDFLICVIAHLTWTLTPTILEPALGDENMPFGLRHDQHVPAVQHVSTSPIMGTVAPAGSEGHVPLAPALAQTNTVIPTGMYIEMFAF